MTKRISRARRSNFTFGVNAATIRGARKPANCPNALLNAIIVPEYDGAMDMILVWNPGTLAENSAFAMDRKHMARPEVLQFIYAHAIKNTVTPTQPKNIQIYESRYKLYFKKFTYGIKYFA